MKIYFGKKQFGTLTAACLLFAGLGIAGPTTAAAQDQATATTPPPKVLVIQREFLKPGKAGSVHQKSESAFVQAFSEAKSPEHYLAMDSLSGKSRTLFFLGYDSFADWEKDNQALQNNSTLAAAVDSAQQADGELLTSYESSTFVFQPDKSVSPAVNIGQMRYLEITVLMVREGHEADWDELVKTHNKIYGNMPNAHWAMYKKVYGANSGSQYIAVTPMRSLAEVDAERVAAKQAASSAGAEQMNWMGRQAASTLKSIETNLFALNPKMSYPRDNWRAADPGFWGQQ